VGAWAADWRFSSSAVSFNTEKSGQQKNSSWSLVWFEVSPGFAWAALWISSVGVPSSQWSSCKHNNTAGATRQAYLAPVSVRTVFNKICVWSFLHGISFIWSLWAHLENLGTSKVCFFLWMVIHNRSGLQTGWQKEIFHTRAFACFAIKNRSLSTTCWSDASLRDSFGSSFYRELGWLP
jgi:hypothetical protein